MNRADMDKGIDLVAYIKEFIERHKVECAESIYQTDMLIEAAPAFMEKCCEIVGYHKVAE